MIKFKLLRKYCKVNNIGLFGTIVLYFILKRRNKNE